MAFLDSLMIAANNQLPLMKREQLTRFLWGLSRVGVSWASLSLVSQRHISAALQRLSNQMSVQELVRIHFLQADEDIFLIIH